MAKKKKTFQLTWAFENFEEHESFYTKKMFGGLAAYCHNKMVMVLTESPGEREYRGRSYDFDIWDGIMIPTNYEDHQSLQKDFPELIQHPVLKKWLYLPISQPQFEAIAHQLSHLIQTNDERIGVYPKID